MIKEYIHFYKTFPCEDVWKSRVLLTNEEIVKNIKELMKTHEGYSTVIKDLIFHEDTQTITALGYFQLKETEK